MWSYTGTFKLNKGVRNVHGIWYGLITRNYRKTYLANYKIGFVVLRIFVVFEDRYMYLSVGADDWPAEFRIISDKTHQETSIILGWLTEITFSYIIPGSNSL